MFFIERIYVLFFCCVFALSIKAQDRSKAIALKDVLQSIEKQHDIYFNYIVAVSAGACNGMSYVSRQPRRARLSNIDYLARYNYIVIRHLVSQGCIFDSKLLYDKFPNKLLPFDFDEYFKHSKNFEMVTTNCLTGLPMYLKELEDHQRSLDIVRASSSLPYVSKIVHVDGIPMLDGGHLVYYYFEISLPNQLYIYHLLLSHISNNMLI